MKKLIFQIKNLLNKNKTDTVSLKSSDNEKSSYDEMAMMIRTEIFQASGYFQYDTIPETGTKLKFDGIFSFEDDLIYLDKKRDILDLREHEIKSLEIKELTSAIATISYNDTEITGRMFIKSFSITNTELFEFHLVATFKAETVIDNSEHKEEFDSNFFNNYIKTTANEIDDINNKQSSSDTKTYFKLDDR